MAKTPKIRFKNFSDEWVEHKLGDYFTERVERSNIGELISVTINSGIRKFYELGRHDNSSDDKSNYKRVEIDDIAYNSMRMWQGASGRSPYSGILSPAYTVIIPKEGINSVFFSYVFKLPNMIYKFKIHSQGLTTDTWNLKFPAFAEIEASKPTIAEQRKISEFFTKLDKLIALHQSKFEKLQKIKKSCLQNLFPQNNQNTPKIRFKNFSDEWVESKLGEISERITRKNSNLETTLPLTISSQYGLVDQSAYFNNRVASLNLSKYYLIKNGEFAYNKSYSDGFPYGSIKRLDNYSKGALSTLYIIFAIKNAIINSNYLQYFYNTKIWHNDVAMVAAEGARNHGLLNITAQDFFTTNVKFPSNLEEQEKIGAFFSKLDKLITLHQSKFKKLQKIKKSCLQNMFV